MINHGVQWSCGFVSIDIWYPYTIVVSSQVMVCNKKHMKRQQLIDIFIGSVHSFLIYFNQLTYNGPWEMLGRDEPGWWSSVCLIELHQYQ